MNLVLEQLRQAANLKLWLKVPANREWLERQRIWRKINQSKDNE